MSEVREEGPGDYLPKVGILDGDLLVVNIHLQFLLRCTDGHSVAVYLGTAGVWRHIERHLARMSIPVRRSEADLEGVGKNA